MSIKERIKGLGRDELIKGSFILFVTINIFNILNYVFHLAMARLLGPAGYGIIATLMSLVYIFSVSSESIQTAVSKNTSRFNSFSQIGKIKDLTIKALKNMTLLSLVAFIILIPVSMWLSNFLKIDFWLIILTNVILFFIFTTPVLRGVLQGRKKFMGLGMNMIIESLAKLLLASFFVIIGFKVYGAVIGIILGFLIALLMIFISFKDVFRSKRENSEVKQAYSYNMPILISMIVIVLMYSLDIIIVKGFFDPVTAGEYAVASMFGKIIFFATYAIGKTMFPFSSEEHEKGKNTKNIFKKSLIMTSLLIIAALLLYLLFPKFLISILFGSSYVGVSNVLFLVGLGFSFVSLANLIILYKLSVNRLGSSTWIMFIFLAIQIILFCLFHSSIKEFAIALLISNFLLFLYSLFIGNKNYKTHA